MTHSAPSLATSTSIRSPVRSDGKRVYDLIRACPPLDVNSRYGYLLLCTHFASSSAIAEHNGTLIGCALGYKKPSAPNTLFVWQIAVHEKARGKGLAGKMISSLITPDIQFLEASILPSNIASFALFDGIARAQNTTCSRDILFSADDFGTSQHEDEVLIRIGPFHTSTIEETTA